MRKMLQALVGRPLDVRESTLLHRMSLVPLLAWIGLGADGLSSSCYGPEKGFLALRDHTFLVLPMAGLVTLTITVLSLGYMRVIRLFPGGGGGYVVATRLLGAGPGLVTGSALVLDYILTIAMSIASAQDHIFSFLPEEWRRFKLVAAVVVLALLTISNLRGVRESVLVLTPIFLTFLITHLLMISAAFITFGSQLGPFFRDWSGEASSAVRTHGLFPTLFLLFSAFAHGAGTFTGIEAVSNSTQILREPRVETARRTMFYMAVSLVVTAVGLLFGYLLAGVRATEGLTLNAVLFSKITTDWPIGGPLVIVSLLSAGALLIVAAQTGFIGGPRTLATMAGDRWVPARFAHMSNRLVIADGVVFMGIGALIFLIATAGNVERLVVLYSVSVFFTFVFSQLGMCAHWFQQAREGGKWMGGMATNGAAFLLSLALLCLMLYVELENGGWVGFVLVGTASGIGLTIRSHYRDVQQRLRLLDERMLSTLPEPPRTKPPKDPNAPTAVIVVSGFNGLGLHTLMRLHMLYPGYYRNFVFVSVGQVDYELTQHTEKMDHLATSTLQPLDQYRPYVESLGGHFEARVGVSTDVVEELERQCLEAARKYPRSVVFGSQLAFSGEPLLNRLLHSFVAYELQRRLHLAGMMMMIIPARV